MNFPKIKFKYSSVYNRGWKIWIKNYKHLSRLEYPEEEKVVKYVRIIQEKWSEIGENILKEIAKVTSLGWQEKEMLCYVVGICRPLSDPLTIMVWEKNLSRCIDSLTHELIHRIFSQNKKSLLPVSDYIARKYKNESLTTRIHIPVHAVHWHILIKLFGEERIEENIRRSTLTEDYRRSWEIVAKEGYIDLIKEFKRKAKINQERIQPRRPCSV